MISYNKIGLGRIASGMEDLRCQSLRISEINTILFYIKIIP
jgi:hypothetical protein